MGLSVSASAAILFVAFVVCFATLFGAVSDYREAMDDAADHQSQRILEAGSTSIAIQQMDAANGTFIVVNEGQATLDLTDFEVLVNGVLLEQEDVGALVLGHSDSQLVFFGDRVLFQTGADLEGSRVTVITSLGSTTTYDPN